MSLENSSGNRRWKRYPKYKDSGVEWLGQVPDGWDLKKLHRVLHRNNHKNGDSIRREMLSLSAYRGIVLKEYENDDLIRPKEESLNYIIVKPGQLVVNPMWVINSSIGVSKINGIVSPAYRVYDVSKEFNGTFFHNLLKTPLYLTQYNRYIRGLTTYDRSVREDDFYEIEVVIPSLLEQSTIAVFLDRITARIDSLVTEKEQQIELLHKKQATIISHAVTKGLDPNVNMKDSGMEFIGMVPSHWKILALKRIVKTKITDGPHDTPILFDEGIPFISAESIKNSKIDFNLKRGFISYSLNEKYKLKVHPQKNDIFIVKSGATTGTVAKVEVDFEFSIWSPLALIRVDGNIVNVDFLFKYLQSEGFKKQVEIFWSFGTQQNIGMNVIERLYCIIPPLNEQSLIASHLERETISINDFIGKIRHSIDLLKEYRTALISAAVTGKIDVRAGSA